MKFLPRSPRSIAMIAAIVPTLTTGVFAGEAGTTATAAPLTLRAAIDLALENNRSIAASEWATRTVDAQQSGAERQRFPSLRARIGGQTSLDDQRIIPASRPNDPGIYATDLLSGDLVVSVPVYSGGRVRAEVDAASLAAESARWRLERERAEIVYDVSSSFYRMLSQERVIEALAFSRRTLDEHRVRIELLIAQNKAARVDLLRVSVRIADIDQQLVRERNALAVQRRVLANLLGTPDADPAIAGELAIPGADASVDASALVATAYERRPDYRAVRDVTTAQSRRIDVARSARLPAIALQGAWGVRAAASGANRGEWDDIGSIGLVIETPVYDGRTGAKISEEASRLSLMEAQDEELRQRIRLDVESAVLDRQAAAERVRATDAAVALAEEMLSIERESYELGRATVTDVLDAQEALLNAQANRSRALADYHIAAARLTLATGNPE